MKTLDQLRAGRAYAAIAAGNDHDIDNARKLPATLQSNGLLATWAFHLADEKRRRLLVPLLEHLRACQPSTAIRAAATPEEAFLAWVGSADQPGLSGTQLRDLTAEALAFSGWLKRAAEAGTSDEQPAAPGGAPQ